MRRKGSNPFSGEDINSGRPLSLQAQIALEHGMIYRCSSDFDVGEYVLMIDPEANRFVLRTGREHFSHDLGWTPITGDSLERACSTVLGMIVRARDEQGVDLSDEQVLRHVNILLVAGHGTTTMLSS